MPPTKLGQHLAPRVLSEKLARVEPVHRAREPKRPVQLRAFAAVLPQLFALRGLAHREHFFHASVAVRAHHEKTIARGVLVTKLEVAALHPHDDIVVKLALLPVRHQVEFSAAIPHHREQVSEHHRRGQLVEKARRRGQNGHGARIALASC